MTVYSLKQLTDIGIISQQLKRVLVLLGCSTSEDMIELSNDWIKVDYIEKSHKLKDQLFKAISDIKELDSILPEFVASANTTAKPQKTPEKNTNKRSFKVGDYTEHLLEQSSTPIKVEDLLQKIRCYLPETYIESIRANLNGDPRGRFVFFLDGYVGLKRKEYDKKKIQYAEQRIIEFLSFMEEKHRSPQPHGLEAEESLYRWYLDFTKSTAKELAGLRATFQQYLKEYDQWMFTPFEYSYKRNCDQVKWYVEENLELPTQEDEPELAAWFNSQLECYEKHKDKRKKMFVDLKAYLEDYGMHFYDAKSGPRTNLRVVLDGETFENEKAVTTFIEVMKRIGLERVRSLGLTWCKIPLVDTKENEKYTQKFEDGYYINVNSSTEQKQKHLYDIAEGLGLKIIVEVTSGDRVVKEEQQRENPQNTNQIPIQATIQQVNPLVERYIAYIMRDHNESTARWYARVLNNQVRDWIERIDGEPNSIFGFNTLEEVSMCIEQLKASPAFVEENHRMRNVMTAALNKYYQFLQSPMAKYGI